MSVIMPCSQSADGLWPEGAYVSVKAYYAEGPLPDAIDPRTGYRRVLKMDAAMDTSNLEMARTRVMCETHKGLVLETGERNGYDDSDFTATVWIPEEQKAETFVYASTRGWTYDHHASVDATDEVRAAYKAKCDYGRRRAQVMNRRAASKLRAEKARALGVELRAIKRLEHAYGRLDGRPVAPAPTYYSTHSRSLAISYGFYREPQQIDRVLALVESGAKGRLRNAFKKKLAEQVLTWLRDPAPQYDTPLSKKQVQYV